MTKTEIIRNLIDKTGLNIKAFSKEADIPYSTLRSMLDRGVENASVNNVIKVCQTLGITIEELYKMSDDESVRLDKEETPKSFATAKEATEYLLKIPSMAAYGGYDIKEMTDEEIIEFANELLHQFELISHKYKK